jgi:hypothetical protein
VDQARGRNPFEIWIIDRGEKKSPVSTLRIEQKVAQNLVHCIIGVRFRLEMTSAGTALRHRRRSTDTRHRGIDTKFRMYV